ncbi:MAG: M20/M25/M40 family metallo-hydrolase [Oscillospiraceae bacterium]|nr:M20/M25/M40 family metallo-hydrolase [Oscillospiraceae bacterium]
MIETVKTLCALNGVSGSEDAVRDYILTRVMPYADKIDTDAMGNVLVFKKGAKDAGKIMLAAHMDEVGLIITHITDEGYLKFSAVGGIDRRVLLGKKVFIGEKALPGIIGVRAIHLVSAEEEKKSPAIDEMYIDIGAPDRDAALKLVSPGDVAAFEGSVYEYGDGWIKAKALDDRMGCAIMIKLIESNLPCDTWFAFTVQEEVGVRGAATAAYALAPDTAIVIEGTTAADFPSVSGEKRITICGDGAVISLMDGGAIYDRKLFAAIRDTADKNGIKWQIKSRVAGGTDAAAIQRAGAGVTVGGLSLPVRNIHSPTSHAKISDIEAIYALITKYLEEYSA